MKNRMQVGILLTTTAWLLGVFCMQARGASPAPSPSVELQPKELAEMLHASEPPLVLQIGVHRLFLKEHITGSRYIGPAGSDQGLTALRESLKREKHDRLIVLYCGCCPWDRCPNVHPALDALQQMGFSRVKILHLDVNFNVDWVQKGYPTELNPD